MEIDPVHYDTVIIGGGAGGLELAALLGRRLGPREGRERVLLADRSSFHIWKPTLHEVAAGTLDPQQEGLSYTILARRNHFSFVLGDLIALDPSQRRLELGEVRDKTGAVLVPRRTIDFNRLVLALGSGSNSFGTPGFEHAFVLEQASDAQRFHTRLLNAFLRHEFSPEQPLRIAIVGAGATGVELSAELLEAHNELLGSLRAAQRFALEITLVEAAERILGGLPERMAARARRALENKGVRVLTGAKVTAIEADRLSTSAGDICTDLTVWAAGIKAADGNRGFGLEVNRLNQFVVNDRLETSSPGIYAIGDCAACPWRDGKMVPARAQAAHQQAAWLAPRLLGEAAGRAPEGGFVYREFGSLVSLGDNKGVGNLMGGLSGPSFFVEGLVAKWMYMSLHLMHHRVILGVRKTAVLALARLLQNRVAGRLKMH